MQYILMALMAAGIVAADQFSKFWVVNNIASSRCGNTAECLMHIEKLKEVYHVTEQQLAGLPSYVEGIPGVVRFSFVHNNGAAFSSFQGQQWLFLLVFVLFTAAVIWEFTKGKMGFTRFEKWCIAAVYAGGLGNMIDRLRLGYVVDMIQTEFMTFPVFNVADCFISCGCIALIVSLVFFNRKFWKGEKK